jgi:heme exporter protein B
MSQALTQIGLLIGKDLRSEFRSRGTLSLVIVLGLLIITVLGLGLGAEGQAAALAAPAILWVAYLFGGVLCFEKTMAMERQDGALAGLMMAPVDRGVIYLSKLLSNLVLMLLLVAVITPFAIVFFNFDLSAAPLGFAAVMAVSMVGFAAIGTLFAAVVSSTRLAGGLLAMLVFPIALPLVLASTRTLMGMFGPDAEPLGGLGLGVLVAFDVVFLAASWLVFELVLEP